MLSLSRMVALLAAVGEIEPDAARHVIGRVQYFQREGFPAGINTGRQRADYGLEPVFQLVWTFELLRMGLPPLRAMQLVRETWTTLRHSIAPGAAEEDEDPQPYALFALDALGDLGGMAGASEGRAKVRLTFSGDPASAMEHHGMRSAVVVDAARLVETALRELKEVLGFEPGSILHDALGDLAARLGKRPGVA